jgi:hypothetical protein
MSRGLEHKLATLKANEVAHNNRWKFLQTYPTANTARVSASRLRRRYSGPEWEFRTTKRLPDGLYGVGVMFKRPDSDGRAPEEEDE